MLFCVLATATVTLWCAWRSGVDGQKMFCSQTDALKALRDSRVAPGRWIRGNAPRRRADGGTKPLIKASEIRRRR